MWNERVLAAMPVRVVADRDDLLAVYIAEGAPFTFPEQWPWDAQHPWEQYGRWQGHGALVLHRPGDAYTVWAFWTGPERTFAGWYINLQAPFQRAAETLDTFDHELDLVVEPDGVVRYKDDDLLERRVHQGRFSPREATEIRATAAEVVRQVERGERWWAANWSAWEPDPSW